MASSRGVVDPAGPCRPLGAFPPGAGCRVPGAGCRVPGAGCRVPGAPPHRVSAGSVRPPRAAP
ncbi:hypothetical protein CXR04_21055 [Streptomyces sp. CMB-StM0423]|nr:hypothetical protein CXR04_21055 [Streptomyces sp. CMB-StM0423]